MTMPEILLLAPVVAPVLAAGGYALLGWRRASAWLGAVAATIVLAAAITLATTVAHSPLIGVAGLVRVDALTAFMLIVIGAIALLATAATPAYFAAEIAAGRATTRTAARHSVLVGLFVAAMSGAVLAASLGVLWVAIEATTIITAFLVGQRRTRAAVEAAWKYVVICSTGIALALLGTLILNYAATNNPAPTGLNLAELAGAAHGLDQPVTRIAVVLLIIGFGTKVGLVPLHAWLPDAHSQAPAPVSALMSGVLLSVAFYAILRVKTISDAALGPGFARVLLLVMALGALTVAATLLLAQRDYKRMLAYHSIEHMGLLALGAAIGTPLALAAVLLHVLGHGLAKAVLFLGAGRILQLTGTTQVDQVRGLAGADPVLAGCVGLGVFALLGFPPFSLFASELGMFRAGYAAGLGAVITLALVLVLVITAALFAHSGHMLLGNPSPALTEAAPRATSDPRTPTPATTAMAAAPATTTTLAPTPAATHTATPTAAAAPAITRTATSTVIVLFAGLLTCAVLGMAAGPLARLLRLAADTIAATP